MTASWGHLGAVWGKEGKKHKNLLGLPTAVVYVRPQRYTKQFMDTEAIFTLSVFDHAYRDALITLGSHSGRDEDKVSKLGLTALFDENTTYFKEAKMVFICRKIYQAPLLEEGFVDASILKFNYDGDDLHEMYIGEILKVLVCEEQTNERNTIEQQ
jgi:flavin reductase (DIM6/NTAB) family NADH-FMN oxidoreductase RutF